MSSDVSIARSDVCGTAIAFDEKLIDVTTLVTRHGFEGKVVHTSSLST